MAGCPSCSALMEHRSLARKPTGEVDLDLCFACHAIWFDQFESTQLTPGSVIDLFKVIHEHGGQHARPLADSSRCPRCRERLVLTHDIQRTNKISYYRCPRATAA
jgi:Zn-finger nucleic acid-binding protein